MSHTKMRQLLVKWYNSAGSFVRRILALLNRFMGVVFGFFGRFGVLPTRWFVVLNCVYVAVTLVAVSLIPGASRLEAAQADTYFKNFYGSEIQREANGTFIRNYRWSAQEGVLTLIRQPNDTGLSIFTLTATTVIDNQIVEVDVQQQRIGQFVVQPQVFRTYESLVRVPWQPLHFWDEIQIKSTQAVEIDGRSIAFSVSEVGLTPLTDTKYPHGMVLGYLFLVMLISTWVYATSSSGVFNAVYCVLVALLIGFWQLMADLPWLVTGMWQFQNELLGTLQYDGTVVAQLQSTSSGIGESVATGVRLLQSAIVDLWKSIGIAVVQLQSAIVDLWQNIALLSRKNAQILWLVCGTVFNVLLVYVVYVYRARIRVFMAHGVTVLAQRMQWLNRLSAPVSTRLRWLWQRPILLYSLTIIVFFSGLLWNTQVIAPNDSRIAVNIPYSDDDTANAGGFFSDYLLFFVPEQYLIANEPRSTWVSTWTNKTELGRELRHYGLSQSYVLNWGMQFLFSDPFVFFTVAFVVHLYLTGLFAFLYVRRLLQQTSLALLAAYVVTFSPFFFFWNTYSTFYTAACWGVGILYGLLWLRDTLNWKSVLFLTFAVYSLFSLAYPQYIVYFAYMVLGYYAHEFWQLRNNTHKKWPFVGYSVLAVAVGTSMTIPQYLDLLQATALTDVTVRNLEYYLLVFPKFDSASRMLEMGLAYVLRDIFEPLTKFKSTLFYYRGANTTLVVFLLMMVGAIWRWRQTWGWSLWIIIAFFMSFNQTAFVFGYEQLRLPQLSRGLALFSGVTQIFPQMILVIYGVHVILSEQFNKTFKILLGMFAVGFQLIVVAGAMKFNDKGVFTGMQQYVAFELLIVVCILMLALLSAPKMKWAVIYGVMLLQAIMLLQPMLVTKPIESVDRTSPSTEMIQQTLQPGERMALIENPEAGKPSGTTAFKRIQPFGGNYNAVSEVANIGTYSSLQSKYYVALMKRFGYMYVGRVADNMYVRRIPLPLPENDQWMANIRTVVSEKPVSDPSLALAFRTEGHTPFYVYTTPSTMGCCLQVPMTSIRIVRTKYQTNFWVDEPKAPTNRQLQQDEHQGDRFAVNGTEMYNESIIVFSQIYHPHWFARVRTAEGWKGANTIVVNEAYQGVRVPAGTVEVVMEFRPWIYWGIITNLIWLGCGLFIAARWLWRYEPLHSWVRHMRNGIA